jgi:integrase
MRAKRTGCIRKVKGSRFWHIYYYCNGRQIRESSKSESKLTAERLLHRRFIEMGILSPPTTNHAKLKYEDIRESLLEENRARGRRFLKMLEYEGLKHLDDFFAGSRVATVTTHLLRTFIRKRKARGAVTNSALNRNLALLRRMMNLAREEGKIQFLPPFPDIPKERRRKQFLSPEDFEKLREELPKRLHPIVTFLYLTGCRLGEARELQCSHVDFDALEIRKGGLFTDDGWSRMIPLDGLEPFVEELRLKEAPRRQEKASNDESEDSCDHPRVPLFCTTNLRKQWRRACVRRGLGWMEPMPGGREIYRGLLLQQLRRSAVRNLLEVGVSDQAAMTIAGYRRHGVTDKDKVVGFAEPHDAIRKVLEKTGIAMKEI